MINQEIQSKIEELIINNLQESQIPALSIAIVENNQVIYANGFGARRIRGNLPASEKTLYGIGSSTKSFTALAIMQLVEEEKSILMIQFRNTLHLNWVLKKTNHN